MANNAIKGFMVSGSPRYLDAKYVDGKEISGDVLDKLGSGVLGGLYVNTSNNMELSSAAIGAEKLNLVAAQAVQIKLGVDKNGKGEALQLDNERHGADATEFTVKVCNGAQPKATRVVGLKVNAAEVVIDNQKNNTTEFDTGSVDLKVRRDKWNSGQSLSDGSGPIYLKAKARAFDFRCYDHGGIALQVAGTDGNGKENKIKFESDRTTEPGATATYCGEGGKGLEFGTFNNLHTSLYTGDYRFKGDAKVYGVTRNTPVATSTGKIDYPTQADDFKDVINTATPSATWNEILDAANKCKNLDETINNKVAEAAMDASGIDVSGFVTRDNVQDMVNQAMADADVDLTGYATEQWVLDKHYIDAIPDGLQYVGMGKKKGNFAVDVTGKYTWELTSPKSATTVDEYGESHVKGDRVINYSNEAFYTDANKVYYKAGMDTTFADGTEAHADDIVYAPECNLVFNLPEGAFAAHVMESGSTSFYEDPAKFAYKCLVKGALDFEGVSRKKKDMVEGAGLSEEAIAFYDSKATVYDEDGVTVLVEGEWERVDIWKKSTLWSKNEININLETDSKIKFAGKKIETVWTYEENGEDVDHKMDDILLSTNTLTTDANSVVFEQKISKNGDRSGQDTELVYAFGNNVADTEKVADFAAFKANYNGKHTPKSDEELQAMYDAFLAEGESYEIRVKVSELLGLVARVAALEAKVAAMEATTTVPESGSTSGI